MSSPINEILPRRSTLRLGVGSLAAMVALCGQSPAGSTSSASLEARKAQVRRVFEEIINNGDTAVIDEVYAPVFVDRTRAARRFPHLAGMPVSLDAFRAVCPDIFATVEEMIAEGNLVATRIAWRGLHPPAGTHIAGQTMHLSRIGNERIVEEWSVGWEWLNNDRTRSNPGPNPLRTR